MKALRSIIIEIKNSIAQSRVLDTRQPKSILRFITRERSLFVFPSCYTPFTIYPTAYLHRRISNCGLQKTDVDEFISLRFEDHPSSFLCARPVGRRRNKLLDPTVFSPRVKECLCNSVRRTHN